MQLLKCVEMLKCWYIFDIYIDIIIIIIIMIIIITIIIIIIITVINIINIHPLSIPHNNVQLYLQTV